jgi:hypothetical protein
MDSNNVTVQLQNSSSTSVPQLQQHQHQRLTKRPSVDSGIHLGSIQSSDSLPSLRSRANKLGSGRETPKLSRFVFVIHYASCLLYVMLYTYLHYCATEWAGIVLIGLICVQEVCSSNPVWRLPVLTSFLLSSVPQFIF